MLKTTEISRERSYKLVSNEILTEKIIVQTLKERYREEIKILEHLKQENEELNKVFQNAKKHNNDVERVVEQEIAALQKKYESVRQTADTVGKQFSTLQEETAYIRDVMRRNKIPLKSSGRLSPSPTGRKTPILLNAKKTK